MISANEFIRRWTKEEDEPLVTFTDEAIKDITISENIKLFLKTAGLPESAAPFLSFEELKSTPLASVSKEWGLPEEYERYKIIGSNGSGDPVCIDINESSSIVYLNHDNYFKRVFINSSIPQLAESLLLFRDFVHKVQKEYGEDAYLDNRIPDNLIHWLYDELKKIDEYSVDLDGLWGDELSELGYKAT